MNREVLISGGAGEIGSRLVASLSERGHRLRVLTLPSDPGLKRLRGLPCRIFEGDITRPESLTAAHEGVDVVFHLAAVLLEEERGLFSRVNVDGTAHMLAAAKNAGVEHFIHVSSASVVYPITTTYSRSKRAAERLVARAEGMHVTIVRPTLVYDGEGGLEFALFARHVRRFPIVPLIGAGDAKKRPVHIIDLLGGLSAMVGNPKCYGKTYNLSGGETVSIRDLAQLIAARYGWRRRFLALPLPLCQAAAVVARRVGWRRLLMEHTLAGLTQDADLNYEEAKRDLGYAPKGVREGMGMRA